MNVLMIIGLVICLLSFLSFNVGLIYYQIYIKNKLKKNGKYYSQTNPIEFFRMFKDYRELSNKRGNESLKKVINRVNKLVVIAPLTIIFGLLIMVVGKSML